MDRRDFDKSIRAALGFLEGCNLTELVINISSLDVSHAFNEVALDRSATYEEIYRRALSLNHFNFQLSDYSLLQFSWKDDKNWRLAFYPNPWITGVESATARLNDLRADLGGGLIGVEEFLDILATDFRYYGAIPMLRFEYSHDQYRPVIHPASHFHIGIYGDDRWSSRRKFSPISFSMLIVRMFYTDVWSLNTSFHVDSVVNCWEKALRVALGEDGVSIPFDAEDSKSLHFNC